MDSGADADPRVPYGVRYKRLWGLPSTSPLGALYHPKVVSAMHTMGCEPFVTAKAPAKQSNEGPKPFCTNIIAYVAAQLIGVTRPRA